MADVAERGGHVLGHPLAIGIGVGFLEIAVEEFQDAVKPETFFGADFFAFGVGDGRGCGAAIGGRPAVENQVLHARGLLFKRDTQVKTMRVRAKLNGALEQRGAGTRAERAVEEGTRPIDDNARGIEIVFGTETVAGGTRAVRRVETERARLELRNGNAAIGTGKLFGEDVVFASDYGNSHQAGSELQRGSDGLLETRGDALLDEQPVDNDFDGVIFALVEDRRRVEGVELAINAYTHVAVLRELFQLLAIGAFAAAHDRGEDHDAIVGLAEVAVENGLHDLFAGLASDGLAAIGAVRDADGAVNDAEIVVDFGDGADGGARGAGGGLLLDGDGGGQAFDYVHLGTLHLV